MQVCLFVCCFSNQLLSINSIFCFGNGKGGYVWGVGEGGAGGGGEMGCWCRNKFNNSQKISYFYQYLLNLSTQSWHSGQKNHIFHCICLFNRSANTRASQGQRPFTLRSVSSQCADPSHLHPPHVLFRPSCSKRCLTLGTTRVCIRISVVLKQA